MQTTEILMDKDTTTRDIVIYGYGKIGKAIKLLADRAKDSNLYFTSQVFTVDTNGTAQFDSIGQIKELPHDLIHIIAIDTGIELDNKSENGYIPNTYKVRELIEEIISERVRDDSNDIIIIESTVEIGFYDSLKDIRETYPNLIIAISPERYNEDTTTKDGFTMDETKLIGIEDSNYELSSEQLSEYINIFSSNNISVVVASVREVEATKVVENSYNYLRFSFINELQWNFGKLGIDLETVLSLAGTKKEKTLDELRPGLIGGGCIPIDPLYLPNIQTSIISKVVADEASRLNELTQIVIKLIENSGLKRIGLMGASYKKHSTSTKNSMYLKLIGNLNKYFASKYSTPETKEDAPKIFIMDHLSVGTPDKYFNNENLSALELILIGANHRIELNGKEIDYKEIAINSGCNVFDLNNLAIYKKGE